MRFEDPKDVWDWYHSISGERILNKDFLNNIDWSKVNRFTVEPHIVRVLKYFRDVELLTRDMYGPEQYLVYGRKKIITPQSFSDCIASFLDIWVSEEVTHGEIHERILSSCDVPPYQMPKIIMPTKRQVFLHKHLGEYYMAIHMTWGAVNELSTQAGYLRLSEITSNRELQRIFKAISQEEARHLSFYLNMAKLLLQKSYIARILVYNVLKNKWRPVGGGETSLRDALPALELFAGREIWRFEDLIKKKINPLPGMSRLSLSPALKSAYSLASAS